MLTDLQARKMKAGDKVLADGTVRGLYLFPSTNTGAGKWIFRFVSPVTGKRRDMGLGRYPEVSIRDARAGALECRRVLESGGDPLEQKHASADIRQQEVAVPTFAEAARLVHAEASPGFRNAKHAAQWINTLEHYVIPQIGDMRVSELRAPDFAHCLKPIWLSKPETASRVRQRCDAVMNWCAAHGHIIASPVRVVDQLLARQPGKRERVEHHPALPWRDLPEFVANVLHAGKPTKGKLMLELLILTAVRSGEVRGMRWEEIDAKHGIWTIPADRMKAKSSHRVPLPLRAMTMLGMIGLRPGATGLVFSSRNGTPLSDMVLTKLLRDHQVPSDVPGRFATAHGFRSTFRDWASENGYPRDLAERALAHTISNSVEAAYHRTDLLEQRRGMMEEWAEYCLVHWASVSPQSA